MVMLYMALVDARGLTVGLMEDEQGSEASVNGMRSLWMQWEQVWLEMRC